ncbi:hypothetical protein GCM10025771_41400 [Niveibacterium umoris]|uniref:Uncharacterized protein n=1 Tax=Niveibacterium umoris TaxID=1193620 RepID=A0A840BPD3_9RHOO|nr:contact-dependent growth inhibition system immunity protein [Niveibacterium umoris]MBB4014860.1 hypothetical protein [Niveibacterium umoris]
MRFCDLEAEQAHDTIERDTSSLGAWYRDVRTCEITDLSEWDLCRAVRQRLFLNHVLPVALALTVRDVNAGGAYDGELVHDLASLDAQEFERLVCAKDWLHELERIEAESLDIEVRKNLDDLIRLLRESAQGY